MEKNKSKLSLAASPEPPDYLFRRIISAIEAEKRLSAVRRRILALSCLTASLLIALVPAINLLWQNVQQSGFASFLSLLFSDGLIIVTYWRSFFMALLESLPTFSLAIILSLLLVLLVATKFLVADIIKFNNFKLSYEAK